MPTDFKAVKATPGSSRDLGTHVVHEYLQEENLKAEQKVSLEPSEERNSLQNQFLKVGDSCFHRGKKKKNYGPLLLLPAGNVLCCSVLRDVAILQAGNRSLLVISSNVIDKGQYFSLISLILKLLSDLDALDVFIIFAFYEI